MLCLHQSPWRGKGSDATVNDLPIIAPKENDFHDRTSIIAFRQDSDLEVFSRILRMVMLDISTSHHQNIGQSVIES